MGSAQSVLSTEGVVTALVVAGAVGVGITQMKPAKESQHETQTTVIAGEKGAGTEASGAAAKKNKKKKKAASTPGGTADVAGTGPEDASDTPVSSLAGSKIKTKATKATSGAAPPLAKSTTKDSIPGGFETPVVSEAGEGKTAAASTTAKKSKKKKGQASSAADAHTSGATTPNEPATKSPAPASSSLADSTQLKSSTTASGGKKKQGKGQQQASAKSQQQPAAPSKPSPPPATKTQSQVLDVAAPPSSSSHNQVQQPLDHSFVSIDTDGSWTRVGGSRRSKNQSSATSGPAKAALPASTSRDSRSFNRYATSTDDVDTTTTGNSSPVAEKAELEEDVDESFLLRVAEDASRSVGEQRKTLAEKLLPKPRKTVVDDMLETPANPPLARVIRVQPTSSQSQLQPAPGFSWGDYEDAEGHITTDGDGERDADAEEDEEGWGVVKSRKSKRTTPGASTASLGASTTSASSSAPLTKKQLQNKKRREAEKAANAEQEKDRLARLAAHKRQLEIEKMKEQQKKGKSKESGGMKATIDAGGKLVWE
ncbi:hypothetical protein CVT24_000225 [Panaeolus cyanescens]|uniref:Uncharacterized protein n=1 Tax=Panaeolus cyanescens TaxID=181874 RepID=A0A409VIN4_9AGAR|nr:hypothetical protein CVT24_000225 [Panaeolus cyanescens]